MSELSKYISNLKGEILQWRIEERHSPGTVQVLDAGEWYVADLKALTARVEELEQENAKLLDEVTARRFTDERTDKLLDELEAENERFFRWAYALLVELAVVELERMNSERTAENNWPAGQEWDDINGSSRSIFLRMAREKAGIDNDEFLAVVRSGRFDVDDLYERKALDSKAEIINKAE